MNKFQAYIRLIRPEQWIKNGFVFMPLFFDRHLLDIQYFALSCIAFFAFCFIASSIYCFNDLYDVESDKKHPEKCKRPIASGLISIKKGWNIMIVCALLSASMIWLEYTYMGKCSYMWIIILVYFLLNIAYTIKLKQVVIIDVFVIALGFVFRIVAGGLITGIYISHWIILMTFLLSLFLAFAKRRDDVVIYNQTGIKARSNIIGYNLDFLNQAMTIVATMTMVCYLLYTVSDDVITRIGSRYLYITAIFVLAGIIKYLQITLVDIKSGSPTKILLKNRFIQICVVGWVLSFFVILYL